MRPVDDIAPVISALGGAAGAILTGRVTDTVKRVDRNDKVIDTVSRDRLRLAQTPQVFRIATLMEVWQRTNTKQMWTDEAALLESAGIPVYSVLARHPNPKVTTEADLRVVRAMSHDVIVMRNGHVVEQGPAEQVIDAPQEAYTKALMAAAFELRADTSGVVGV